MSEAETTAMIKEVLDGLMPEQRIDLDQWITLTGHGYVWVVPASEGEPKELHVLDATKIGEMTRIGFDPKAGCERRMSVFTYPPFSCIKTPGTRVFIPADQVAVFHGHPSYVFGTQEEEKQKSKEKWSIPPSWTEPVAELVDHYAIRFSSTLTDDMEQIRDYIMSSFFLPAHLVGNPAPLYGQSPLATCSTWIDAEADIKESSQKNFERNAALYKGPLQKEIALSPLQQDQIVKGEEVSLQSLPANEEAVIKPNGDGCCYFGNVVGTWPKEEPKPADLVDDEGDVQEENKPAGFLNGFPIYFTDKLPAMSKIEFGEYTLQPIEELIPVLLEASKLCSDHWINPANGRCKACGERE